MNVSLSHVFIVMYSSSLPSSHTPNHGYNPNRSSNSTLLPNPAEILPVHQSTLAWSTSSQPWLKSMATVNDEFEDLEDNADDVNNRTRTLSQDEEELGADEDAPPPDRAGDVRT